MPKGLKKTSACPLPSDGRGRIARQFFGMSCVGGCRKIIRKTEGGYCFSLSHRMGEGQGEGLVFIPFLPRE